MPAAPRSRTAPGRRAAARRAAGRAGVGEAAGVAVGVAGGPGETVTVTVGAAAPAGLPEEPHAVISRAAPPSAAAAIMRLRWRWDDVIAVPLIVRVVYGRPRHLGRKRNRAGCGLC